ncbi:MAG: outer membrane beta-barrel protein [Bacteroidia bacterium]
MKKFFAAAITLLFATNIVAQDKDIRFGLSATPSLNWYKPEDLQKFKSNGVGLGFGWGLDVEFKISDIASFYTGLKLNNDRGKLTFLDSLGYELIDGKFSASTPVDSNNFYLLYDRSYKANYVALPLGIKMKTNEIGYLTYFGQFGLITGIKTKATANDNSAKYDLKNKTAAQKAQVSNLDINDDMQLFRFQLSIGGGAEYNLSGSTALVFGVNYNLGFSNVLKKTSKYIKEIDQTTGIKQNATAHNISLSVGILF